MASYKSVKKNEGSNRWIGKDNEWVTHKGRVKLGNNHDRKNVLCNKRSEINAANCLFIACCGRKTFCYRERGLRLLVTVKCGGNFRICIKSLINT